MLKFILKVWPAFLPVIIYILWILLFRKKRKKDYIDAEYKVVSEGSKKGESVGDFSLRNGNFVMVIFSTLLLIILSLIFIVITTKPLKQMPDQASQQKIIVE